MGFIVICLFTLSSWAEESEPTFETSKEQQESRHSDGVDVYEWVADDAVVEGDSDGGVAYFEEPLVLPEHLGPVINPISAKNTDEPSVAFPFPESPLLDAPAPWVPSIVPFLDHTLPEKAAAKEGAKDGKTASKPLHEPKVVSPKQEGVPAKILAVDVHPKMPKIAILIDDLGYNRHGMESSLLLPTEVALAILPSTPFAHQTALGAQKQNRITLLHAPMENQRELKLGPGGLYAKMSEQELKSTLSNDLDGLPGIKGVNNHMGSLLTTKADSMKWVMETLKGRSLFFIDSLTSPKSVAKQTAQEFGLETVSRDVFLDNIRTEAAIDKQFTRLIKLAKKHGSALAIGHPYPETMSYLNKRLHNLGQDGVHLVPVSALLKVATQPAP